MQIFVYFLVKKKQALLHLKFCVAVCRYRTSLWSVKKLQMQRCL